MNGFTDFQPSSSIEIPMTTRPKSLYFSANSMYHGISCLQPWHHVAQKLTRITLPRNWSRLIVALFWFFRENTGAAWRAGTGLSSAGARDDVDRKPIVIIMAKIRELI